MDSWILERCTWQGRGGRAKAEAGWEPDARKILEDADPAIAQIAVDEIEEGELNQLKAYVLMSVGAFLCL